MASVEQIVQLLGHRVQAVHGDPSASIVGFTPSLPGRSGHASFVTGRDQDAARVIGTSSSTAFLAPPATWTPDLTPGKTVIEVAKPRLEFARVAQELFPVAEHPTSSGVSPSARVGDGTVIGVGSVIEADAVIGRNTIIGPHVVIRARSIIGDRVRIGPGSVIGEPGFGFERDEEGRPVRLPHYGRVRIGDDVEIGANTVVDRGVFTDTTIGAGSKIDSQVLVGHNVVVQDDALVIGGAVLCGGVHVGRGAWVAPSSTIMEKVRIGADSVIGIGATVVRDVPDGNTVMGPHARPALSMGR